MEFELGIGIGKNLENGIYEFWEWIGVGKISKNEIHEFWTWNSYVNDLTSKWYVIDLTSNYCLLL